MGTCSYATLARPNFYKPNRYNMDNPCQVSPSVASSLLPSSTVTHLWRGGAQRNLRNQWSKLTSLRPQWVSASSSGRSHAITLANAFLSQKYMPSMELGVLSNMPDVRKKACSKLYKQQELHGSKLLSCYKDLVSIATQMVNASRCMRCYLKGTTSSPLVTFGSSSENDTDSGDGGGISVFAFLSISRHEQFAEEIVQMFICELQLKRLLLMGLLAIGCEYPQVNDASWSHELYPGEFNDLCICNLYSQETGELEPPRLVGGKPAMRLMEFACQPNHETLQVYLTSWLTEVNIDAYRVDEIFSVIGEEMHVTFL